MVMTNSLLLNNTIEIVHVPIENGDYPWLCDSLQEGICQYGFEFFKTSAMT